MNIPRGMSRRHFMKHMAGASALAGSSFAMGNAIKANAGDLKKRRKSAILLWMGGGMAHTETFDPKKYTPYEKGMSPNQVLKSLRQESI
mgnify:CR=1 FL=1